MPNPAIDDRDRDHAKRREPRAGATAARAELLARVQDLAEPVMVGLGLAFLALLVADFAGAARTPAQRLWLDRAMTAIWAAFVVEFAVRLVLAPAKLAFLRANWLSVASLALPFLRPFRILRAVRAARSLSLVRLLGGANRGMRTLQRVARGRQLAYVAGLTVLATLLGAVGVLFFDRDAPGATVRTFGDALWWSSAMVTTINNEKYAVTPEARVVAILLRVFAVSVFGLVTAAVASYFVGRDAEARTGTGDDLRPLLADLRAEQVRLRDDLARVQATLERLATAAEPPPSGEPVGADDRMLAQAAARTPERPGHVPESPAAGSAP